ncbi:hypothetical protein BDY19DRAFT_993623 [Irpex rosettiformis]|uniref:Uncharacterized protein n=1 Tax=Irpex rosettiformis TaxID=378272 RepID=A0ACB8U3K6_9APHY|nr:hypothetical protein BDY19DRAFT_993623 [Irpex rosettiformis]
MRGIAKFNWLLSLSNPAQPLASLVTFRILRFKKRDDNESDDDDDGVFVTREGDGEPAEITTDGAQVDDDQEYAIILDNHSKTNLHVQIWYLDPDDYSIKNLYEPMNDEQPTLVGQRTDSDPPGRLQIGASTEHEWPLKYNVPENASRTTLYVMVFLTTKSIRLGSLDQDPLFGPDAVDDRTIAQGEVDRKDLWDIIRRPIIVTKVY